MFNTEYKISDTSSVAICSVLSVQCSQEVRQEVLIKPLSSVVRGPLDRNANNPQQIIMEKEMKKILHVCLLAAASTLCISLVILHPQQASAQPGGSIQECLLQATQAYEEAIDRCLQAPFTSDACLEKVESWFEQATNSCALGATGL